MNASERRLPKPPTTKRTCLRCGKEFDSTGPENRICRKHAEPTTPPRCEAMGALIHTETWGRLGFFTGVGQ